jgi:c-di-GMP-binding flagellar brake protein YcgR
LPKRSHGFKRVMGCFFINSTADSFEPENSTNADSPDCGRSCRQLERLRIEMAGIEKIEGNAVLQLLKGLQKDKAPLKMRLTEDAEEYLTHISDVRRRRRKFQFKVNSQDAFLMAGVDTDGLQLQFEFTDPNKIKFVFEAEPAEISLGAIWVKFPEFIHRYQRRSLFRMEAPRGTRLYFTLNDTRCKLLVINISLSGSLGVLVSLTKHMEHELQSHQTKILENVELIFPAKGEAAEPTIVKIKRCKMRRHKRNPVTHKFECAAEFIEIGEEERQKLREAFYEWQRDYLRKRKLLES